MFFIYLFFYVFLAITIGNILYFLDNDFGKDEVINILIVSSLLWPITFVIILSYHYSEFIQKQLRKLKDGRKKSN